MWLSVYADLSLQSVSLRKKSLLIPLIIPLSMRPSERSRNSVEELNSVSLPVCEKSSFTFWDTACQSSARTRSQNRADEYPLEWLLKRTWIRHVRSLREGAQEVLNVTTKISLACDRNGSGPVAGLHDCSQSLGTGRCGQQRPAQPGGALRQCLRAEKSG